MSASSSHPLLAAFVDERTTDLTRIIAAFLNALYYNLLPLPRTKLLGPMRLHH